MVALANANKTHEISSVLNSTIENVKKNTTGISTILKFAHGNDNKTCEI